MSEKIDFYIMSLCDYIDVTSDYANIVNKEFHKYGIRFIIVGIDFYTLSGLAYCYQVQTKQFKNGKFRGLYLNNLFQNEFLSLLEDLKI